MTHTILQPPEWARAKGFANGIAARGTLVFIAGQIGWGGDQKFRQHTLSSQVGVALKNILQVLAQAHGEVQHIVRLTWFVTSRQEYLDEIRAIGTEYRAVMGRHFPTMSVVQVSALVEAEAKVEIEATAVIPDS